MILCDLSSLTMAQSGVHMTGGSPWFLCRRFFRLKGVFPGVVWTLTFLGAFSRWLCSVVDVGAFFYA